MSSRAIARCGELVLPGALSSVKPLLIAPARLRAACNIHCRQRSTASDWAYLLRTSV
jgi:hypothetical protein